LPLAVLANLLFLICSVDTSLLRPVVELHASSCLENFGGSREDALALTRELKMS
jgi:hypothetical protein